MAITNTVSVRLGQPSCGAALVGLGVGERRLFRIVAARRHWREGTAVRDRRARCGVVTGLEAVFTDRHEQQSVFACNAHDLERITAACAEVSGGPHAARQPSFIDPPRAFMVSS